MKKITAFAAVLIMLLTCFFGCASAKFTVTYNVDGVLSTETVDSGSTASCAKPENAEGKTFDGWYTDDALTLIYDEKTPVTKDVTLYGTWRETKPQRYVVTFIVDEIPYEVAVNAGEAAAFDEPKKSGYTFNGWYTDQACTKKFDLSGSDRGRFDSLRGLDADARSPDVRRVLRFGGRHGGACDRLAVDRRGRKGLAAPKGSRQGELHIRGMV